MPKKVKFGMGKDPVLVLTGDMAYDAVRADVTADENDASLTVGGRLMGDILATADNLDFIVGNYRGDASLDGDWGNFDFGEAHGVITIGGEFNVLRAGENDNEIVVTGNNNRLIDGEGGDDHIIVTGDGNVVAGGNDDADLIEFIGVNGGLATGGVGGDDTIIFRDSTGLEALHGEHYEVYNSNGTLFLGDGAQSVHVEGNSFVTVWDYNPGEGDTLSFGSINYEPGLNPGHGDLYEFSFNGETASVFFQYTDVPEV